MQETPITPEQCRMARALLRWTLDQVVEASGVSRPTVARLEAGDAIKVATAAKIRAAFEAKYVGFIDDGPHEGGVYPA